METQEVDLLQCSYGTVGTDWRDRVWVRLGDGALMIDRLGDFYMFTLNQIEGLYVTERPDLKFEGKVVPK